jgi:hypothetical protein
MVGSGFQNIFKIPNSKADSLYAGVADRSTGSGFMSRRRASTPLPWHLFLPKPKTIAGAFQHVFRRCLERLSVFALGIMPYISASIILQLLTVSFRTWSS